MELSRNLTIAEFNKLRESARAEFGNYDHLSVWADTQKWLTGVAGDLGIQRYLKVLRLIKDHKAPKMAHRLDNITVKVDQVSVSDTGE
jgi:hypothetical protein